MIQKFPEAPFPPPLSPPPPPAPSLRISMPSLAVKPEGCAQAVFSCKVHRRGDAIAYLAYLPSKFYIAAKVSRLYFNMNVFTPRVRSREYTHKS